MESDLRSSKVAVSRPANTVTNVCQAVLEYRSPNVMWNNNKVCLRSSRPESRPSRLLKSQRTACSVARLLCKSCSTYEQYADSNNS